MSVKYWKGYCLGSRMCCFHGSFLVKNVKMYDLEAANMYKYQTVVH